jgi:hypothetical protein
MERRSFLTIPLAAMAAPAAILAAGVVPAQANVAQPITATAPTLLPAAGALKGVSHAGTDALALKQIRNLNVAWYYSWGSKYTVTTSPGFVPMIRSAKAMDQGAIGNATSQLALTKAKNLLGFNEPDVTAQANMTVDQALRLWPQLQATGMRLGSPATAKPSSLWLEEFMAKAKNKGLRVDFVTMHCYAWPNAEDFLNKVSELHEKYGKPVWVTEYAVADWSASSTKPSRYSRTQIQDFMRASVAGMREMPFVERFAWKTRPIGDPVMGASALYSADGTLTSTGRLYASL